MVAERSRLEQPRRETAPRDGPDRFRDDFGALAAGSFPHDYGPRGEYHAILPAGERAGWYEPVWQPHWRHPHWSVLVDSGEHELTHTGRPGDSGMLVRERGEWREPRIGVTARLLSERTRVALLFGYLDSRRHTRLVLAHRELSLERIVDEHVERLAHAPLAGVPGEPRRLWLEYEHGVLRAGVGDEPLLECPLPELAAGRVGLWADGPARFGAFTIVGARFEPCDVEPGVPAVAAPPARAAPARLWRRLATPGFGTGRQLRFGDLDGDGRLEIVLPQHAKLAELHDHAMITALTALDLDGRVRWTWGAPSGSAEAMELCADLPVQVHDIDGDGRAEVVFASGHRLRVLEGATGRERHSIPLPFTPRLPEARRLAARLHARFREVILPRVLGRLGLPFPTDALWFPWPEDITWRIRGDAIAFCDVSGVGRATDIVIKDRYSHLWVVDSEFRLLWSSEHNTGHFPSFLARNGDTRDDVLAGYRLLAPDGTPRWTRTDLPGHADAVALGRAPGGEPWVAMVTGEAGFLLLDANGTTRVQRDPGHVQRLAIGRFRDDVPGLQFWVATYWGGAGIRVLYDDRGRTLHRSESPGRGQVLLPTHWRADDIDLALVSADPQHGGLMDGHGRTVVRLPDDGHPVTCCAALDLTGDARDEIVCWDGDSIAIYTAADGELATTGARRVRAPHWNASNYRAEISLPAPAAPDPTAAP